MKNKIIAIFLAISLILAVPATALGAQSVPINITMTTGEVVSVSLNRTDWGIGTVYPNAVYKTTADYFTATNDGNVNENFQIASDDTGGAGTAWVLSGDLTNTTAGTYALGYTKTTDTWPGSYAAITKTATNFATNIAANGGTQIFGLGLLTPTITVPGEAKTATVTISCVKYVAP